MGEPCRINTYNMFYVNKGSHTLELQDTAHPSELSEAAGYDDMYLRLIAEPFFYIMYMLLVYFHYIIGLPLDIIDPIHYRGWLTESAQYLLQTQKPNLLRIRRKLQWESVLLRVTTKIRRSERGI